MSSIELLYQGILPSLPQYMVCTVFFYVGIFCVKATTQAEDLKSLMIGFHIGHLKQTSVRVKVSNAKIPKCGSKSSKCNICAKDVAAKDNQRDTTNLI